MRVVARLYHAAGVELPLRTVFEAPTLGDLARALERALLESADQLAT